MGGTVLPSPVGGKTRAVIGRVAGAWRASPRRWRIRVIVAAATLGAYALAGFFLVPWLVARQVRRAVPAALHRSATLAGARFNPFTLALTLVRLDVRDRDATPLFAFDTLVVNLSLGSLFRFALVLDEFRLVGPAIVARLGPDGAPTIADLFPADSTPDTVATGGGPPRLIVQRAAIRGGAITFVDQSRTPYLAMPFSGLGATVHGLSTLPNDEGNHDLVVTFAGGATIRWVGTATVRPLRLEGRFDITTINVPRMGAAFAGSLPVEVSEGRSDVTFRYVVDQAPDGTLQLAVPEGTVMVSQVVIRPRGGEAPWLRLPQVAVRGIRIAYPQRAARIGMIDLREPWIAAALDADGSFSWAPLVDSLLADTTPSRWTVSADTVAVSAGGVALVDRTIDPPATLDLSQIGLRLTSVSTDSAVRMGLAGSVDVAGGRVTLEGGITRAPRSGEIAIEARGLGLSPAQPYLGDPPRARIVGGAVSLQGRARLRAGRPSMVFDGRASLDRLAVQDSAGGPLLSWRTMDVRGIHFTSTPDLLRIAAIRFESPVARIAISREGTLNLATLRGGEVAVPDSAAPDSAPPPAFPYEILEVTLADASIDFSDESLILPFRAVIDSTRGAIRDVASFGATPGSLDLEGHILPNGRARASGTINVADPLAATEIRAEMRNILMPNLTPYSAQFAGYAIEEGRLDIDLVYRIVNRRLAADHHIVAEDLQLGEAVAGGEAPGFLVKLAVSLLKDSEGRIKLDVPVEGDVDDPQFRYSGIVWQALKTILGNIASAPFRFLGNLLGLGGDDVELVDFDPGRSDLLPPEREKLDSLAAELGRRPELVLAIEGRYDSVSDVAAARAASLDARIAARRDSVVARARDDTSRTVLSDILESLFRAQFSDGALDSLRRSFETPDGEVAAAEFYSEVRARLLAAQPVEPGLLERLGRERGTAIAGTMLARGALDTTRVTVRDPVPASRRKSGSVRVASELILDAP